MCDLLVSVRTEKEALLAYESGADFIDLKEPDNGALGALSVTNTQKIVAALPNEAVVSATVGDLPMDPALIGQEIEARLGINIDYLKVGFFGADKATYLACVAKLKHYAEKGIKLIAVLFAEYQYPHGLMALILDAGVSGVMLDTAHKNGETLLSHYDPEMLSQFIQQAKQKGKLVGLAGSLSLAEASKLKLLKPDYLGFRSAACFESNRNGILSADNIRHISKLL